MLQENSEIPCYIKYILSRDKNNFYVMDHKNHPIKGSNLAFIYNIKETFIKYLAGL
jgi:hypothetical protein